MTLSEFHRATAHLPGHTLIGYLSPWGELAPACILEAENLAEDDPVADLITAEIIILTTAEP